MGHGKSTLVNLLNSILHPTSGTVEIDNADTTIEEYMLEIRKRVGVVFQNAENQIISSSVYEDVSFGPQNLKIEEEKIESIVDIALKQVDLFEYKNGETNNLSGGEKQKLAIAGILAMNPKYIIFDEAVSMLDKKSSKQIMEIIEKLNKENKITIIQITQKMEDVVSRDRVIVLNKGKIVVDDTPLEIFKNGLVLKQLGLEAPIGIKLINELRKDGIDIPEDVLTTNECVDVLEELIKSKVS